VNVPEDVPGLIETNP